MSCSVLRSTPALEFGGVDFDVHLGEITIFLLFRSMLYHFELTVNSKQKKFCRLCNCPDVHSIWRRGGNKAKGGSLPPNLF